MAMWIWRSLRACRGRLLVRAPKTLQIWLLCTEWKIHQRLVHAQLDNVLRTLTLFD